MMAIASSTPGSQSIRKRRAGEKAEGIKAADMSAREEEGARAGCRRAWTARYRSAASVLPVCSSAEVESTADARRTMLVRRYSVLNVNADTTSARLGPALRLQVQREAISCHAQVC